MDEPFKPMSETNKVFESDRILVFHNNSGEVFVRNKFNNKAEIRIGDYADSLLITVQGWSQMTPQGWNGLSAIVVSGKINT